MINGSLAHKKAIQVAVAVLKYTKNEQEKFLLAVRQAWQHQGGKIEFVGGKIELDETPQSALIREVNEELGLDISRNNITKMGRIHHDYGDKSVCLHVYQVLLDDSQYLNFKDKKFGLDGQMIGFFDKEYVSSQKSSFPVANVPIFSWLGLPDMLFVSHRLDFFNNKTDWLDFYENLPKNCTLLMRTHADDANIELMSKLAMRRDDLRFIVSLKDLTHGMINDLNGMMKKVMAVRLTQNELMALDLTQFLGKMHSMSLSNLPIIASCHDELSIKKANDLASIHTVMAILLSPVLPTQTHLQAPVLGWNGFCELSNLANMPVVALGGLTPNDLNVAQRHGGLAVAGIRGFV
ncbi:NUDIX domain-containing protein [Moraxella sp. Pampa]|uniref:NUDIX domain-containing protein n=1 Tax=Moraxella sp. Pampa TaxID=3111978 RepID=UPI002B4180F2|nr:NUDIX domain-containing protein [Moraxella sp. Pampa]